MKWTWPGPGLGRLRTLDIQVHHDRFLAAANDHGFHRLVGARVHLLMRHEGRHVDEISRPGFLDVFQTIAPAEACASAYDVEDRLQLAMMVRARAGRRLHR